MKISSLTYEPYINYSNKQISHKGVIHDAVVCAKTDSEKLIEIIKKEKNNIEPLKQILNNFKNLNINDSIAYLILSKVRTDNDEIDYFPDYSHILLSHRILLSQ